MSVASDPEGYLYEQWQLTERRAERAEAQVERLRHKLEWLTGDEARRDILKEARRES